MEPILLGTRYAATSVIQVQQVNWLFRHQPSLEAPLTVSLREERRILPGAQLVNGPFGELPGIAFDPRNQRVPDALERQDCIVVVEADSHREEWTDVLD